MPSNHLRGWTVPLTVRVIVLRLILMAAVVTIIFSTPILVTKKWDDLSFGEWVALVIFPFLTAVHHVLR